MMDTGNSYAVFRLIFTPDVLTALAKASAWYGGHSDGKRAFVVTPDDKEGDRPE